MWHHARLTGLAMLAAIGLASMAAAAPVAIESDDVSIRSDTSLVNLKTGRREHQGAVHASHLNFELWADRLLEVRDGEVLVEVLAEGRPARFRQTAPFRENFSHGVARRAEYRPLERELRLWDYTVTDLEGNTMKGGMVRYLLK